MSKGNKNLLVGVVIGVAAGFIAGVVMASGKEQKVDKLRARLSNLATDAQERINALRAMATKHDEKTKAEQN